MKFKGLMEQLGEFVVKKPHMHKVVSDLKTPSDVYDAVRYATKSLSRNIERDLYGTGKDEELVPHEELTPIKDVVDKVMSDLKSKDFDKDFMKELQDA